jgi:hypothetical protein
MSNRIYSFFVSVPPELPTIIDHWGRQLNTTVGPHSEGDDVILTCRVIGGELHMISHAEVSSPCSRAEGPVSQSVHVKQEHILKRMSLVKVAGEVTLLNYILDDHVSKIDRDSEYS